MQYLEQPPLAGCFFCAALAGEDERTHLVLARNGHAVTLLNKYPYGSGHVMVAPRQHVARLDELGPHEYEGLMHAVRRAAVALRTA